MSKTIVGFLLVDAPHSALNNAGIEASERTENIVRVKTIRRGRNVYPYVSGQALRYWWRTTLETKFDWNLSPLEKVKGKSQVFTKANPIQYEDDDVFGYMRALKAKEGGTVTRISPLKNSPLISIINQVPTQDFGVAARHEGDPVPYEHEFYSTILKGIFSLDLDSIGVFSSKEKTGYKNMYPDLEKIAEKKKLKKREDDWFLPKELRIKRATETISALPYLSGGAKLTPHLTDVSPKFVLLTVLEGGNHIFMNIAKEVDREAVISFEALKEVLKDYSDILLTDIYLGRRKGFMDDIEEEITKLVDEHKNEKRKFIYGSINETIDDFVKEIPKHVE